MKIITVINSKGGSGKSTLVSNLSLEFVQQKHKTLLMDLDPQKTLEGWWKKRKAQDPQLVDLGTMDINKALDTAKRNKFEILFVDTPGYLSSNALKILEVSDLAIIPCKPTAADLRAVGSTIAIIEQRKIPFLFILTQCIPNSAFVLKAAIRLGKFGRVSEYPVFNRVSYANAIYEGVGAGEFDKNAYKETKNNFNYILETLNTRKE